MSMQYHFRVLVYNNGRLVFRTHESATFLTDRAEAIDVATRMATAFPESEGYKVELEGGTAFMRPVKFS